MLTVWDSDRSDGGDAVAEQLRARLGALMREWANHVEYAGGDASATDADWRARWYDECGRVLGALRRRENEARKARAGDPRTLVVPATEAQGGGAS